MAATMRQQQEVHGPACSSGGWGVRLVQGRIHQDSRIPDRIRLLVIPFLSQDWYRLDLLSNSSGFIPEEIRATLRLSKLQSVSLNYSVDLVQKITKEIVLPMPEVEHIVVTLVLEFEGNA